MFRLKIKATRNGMVHQKCCVTLNLGVAMEGLANCALAKGTPYRYLS